MLCPYLKIIYSSSILRPSFKVLCSLLCNVQMCDFIINTPSPCDDISHAAPRNSVSRNSRALCASFPIFFYEIKCVLSCILTKAIIGPSATDGPCKRFNSNRNILVIDTWDNSRRTSFLVSETHFLHQNILYKVKHIQFLTMNEWAWDQENASYTITLSQNNLQVKFHNGFSYGSAAVRGNKLLEKGRHHYWEVKMLTAIYGTDNMVGVGTSKVNLNDKKHTFCSFLGLDQESYGFSYRGYVQHRGEKRNYGPPFGQGSLVGIHLDTWKGTLEFFLNRKPLGIAFSGLRDIALYPMVSSTAARSKMRLTHSCSVPVSLQVDCLSVLKSSHRAYLSAMYPGLRHLTQSIFADILKTNCNDDDDNEKDAFELLTSSMILDDFDFALLCTNRRKRKNCSGSAVDEFKQHKFF